MPPVEQSAAHAIRTGFAALAVAAVAGCGRETGTTAAAPAGPLAKAEAASAEPAAAVENGPFQVRVDASGRKWLTPTIPYDAFPGLPSDQEVAAGGAGAPRVPVSAGDGGAVVASTGGTVAGPAELAPAEQPTPGPSSPAAPTDVTGGGWEEVFPAENLQREIAAVRNALSQNLLTVGSYNESFESVANDGWLMSALATIALEHSASISWKPNALLARDVGIAVAAAATARGRQSFTAAQLAGEQLASVLDNNTPPGLPTPDPAASREETADRAALMARMQVAFDRLKESGADDSALKKNADPAAHEARVLAALAKFTAHGDYGSADEPEYQAAAGKVVTAGGSMAEAAGGEDLAGFKAAFDRAGVACNACHEKYRFSN